MENTQVLLFDNVEKKFFLAFSDRATGPHTAQEIYEAIRGGKITALNFVWCESWSDWMRICEAKEFAALLPSKPSPKTLESIKAKLRLKVVPSKSQAETDNKKYYLFFNQSQFGPFSKKEVLAVIESGKVSDQDYLWTPGWKNWERLSEIGEFSKYLEPVPLEEDFKSIGKASTNRQTNKQYEKRYAPRKPLVARLFLHNDEEVILAVCRDISIGGMQVLTDKVPGEPGTKLKLNVSPASSADADPKKVSKAVNAFVAEGEIVRVLEDGRGFSFRFTKISVEAKKAIKSYIEKQ